MPMMAITTKSSTSVKPVLEDQGLLMDLSPCTSIETGNDKKSNQCDEST